MVICHLEIRVADCVYPQGALTGSGLLISPVESWEVEEGSLTPHLRPGDSCVPSILSICNPAITYGLWSLCVCMRVCLRVRVRDYRREKAS